MDTKYKQDPEIEKLKIRYANGVALLIAFSVAIIILIGVSLTSNNKIPIKYICIPFIGILSFLCGIIVMETDELKEQITAKKKEKAFEIADNFVKNLIKTPFTTKDDEVVVMREDKDNQVYQNLKFREQVISNPCGKIKNEKLKKEFLDTAIAQEHNQYCYWSVCIEDAVKKFKEYEFELKPAYLKILKEYEEKQELLDEYAETKATKPRAKRKTTKKK